MIRDEPLTLRGTAERALELFDRIHADLASRIDESRRRILDALHAEGAATLRALTVTSGEEELSDESAAMIRAYLRGPEPGDEEAAETWMTLLPEVMLELHQREESTVHERVASARRPAWRRHWYVASEELSAHQLLVSWAVRFDFGEGRQKIFLPPRGAQPHLRSGRVRVTGDEAPERPPVACAA